MTLGGYTVEPLETAAEANTRARELYKYYQPSSATNVEPDTILSSHAQLVAWRLNCRRSMVSLLDRDTQYFIAESSKTLHLDDNTRHEDPQDALWAGCINVPKAGRLCEYTLKSVPSPDGRPPYFEVLNLAQDPRFDQLDFVQGPPHFKYYCGVPLRTKRGIDIGSLFALDDKVRDPATAGEIACKFDVKRLKTG
jgi:GAF domain-containing protein